MKSMVHHFKEKQKFPLVLPMKRESVRDTIPLTSTPSGDVLPACPLFCYLTVHTIILLHLTYFYLPLSHSSLTTFFNPFYSTYYSLHFGFVLFPLICVIFSHSPFLI
ncbi:hypothetical protein FKM82_013897 [Ascaphus truei]